MKALLTALLLILTAILPSWAQRTVAAKEILDKINQRQSISYENVTITGDLDLTELDNKTRINDNRWADSEAFESTVETPVTFRNCVFTGAFRAYKNLERVRLKGNGVLYVTNFNEAVTFENCTFEQESEFKYSDFKQRALFTGSSFRKEANFKYTKFRAACDFSDVRFGALANFKYTGFKEAIAFRKTRFGQYADFKYTKFDEGVNFQNSRFNGMADFKYTHLPRNSNFEDAVFDGPADFKYATLNGQKFSPARR